jgi:DNA-binding response OmpR family regulator
LVSSHLDNSPADVLSNGSDADERGRPRARDKNGDLYCPGEVRILVVDDDEQICRLIQTTLASEAFTVDAACEPAEIEARIKDRSAPCHLVILDYVIPGLESEQVLDWLRDFQPDASIIVVTAYPSVDSAVNCLRTQQTFDYLPKPFQPGHLQRVVTRCLEGKGLLRLSEAALRETLGAAIRERRKKMGLTLQQMAHRTNVSLGYLSQIELGKNSASIETLYRICLGLGIKLSELFQTVQPH